MTSEKTTNTNHTKGVETLLGDPKKAIIKLAIPMIIAMSVQTIYNFADALFVSGFGSSLFTSVEIAATGKDALAAVGLVFPFFMMAIALSTGLGIGSASAISRRIGAEDKTGADNVAIHSIMLTGLTALIYTAILLPSATFFLPALGTGDAATMAVSYGQIIFAGSIVIFFINVATAILRGEGDAKRAMYAIILGTILNIILDPLFIFTFELGVAGAAYATILSMGVTCLLLIYWLFFRKDTYVNFHFKEFRFKKDILYDIFRVGIPGSVQQLSMSITMLIINIIIVKIAMGGEDGVAIYFTGWRVVMLAILPMLGLATAVISVTGAAYGAQSYGKLKTAFFYSVKIGFIIEIIMALAIFVLAPFITGLFTTAEESAVIADDLEYFLQVMVLFFPVAALGITSSATFQGVGKGIYSLIATLIRTIFLTIILSLVFIPFFTPAIIGIWWGIIIANLIGSLISFSWAQWHVRSLLVKTQ